MNRNETNRFAVNPVNLDISRSVFDRDHKVLFSGNVGDVIPFYCDEVLPGDTFDVTTSKVVRMQPLVTPIMDNVYLDTYYFYVPCRLLWSHWKQFNGENTASAWIPTTSYTVPQLVIPTGGFNAGTIADYLGIPIKVGAGRKISALPFRAYAKICDDWFRDENLMNPVNISVGDSDTNGSNGSDQVTDIEKGGKPFIAAKYHDYFTSCLPGAQKSAGPSVEFALNGLLPVNAYTAKSNVDVGDSWTSHANGGLGDITFRGKDSSNNATSLASNGGKNTYLGGSYLGYDSGTYSPSGSLKDMTPKPPLA